MRAYVHCVSEEFEEMERIPWAALAASTPDPRRRLAIAAVVVVAVLVLLAIVGGSPFRSSPSVSSGALAAPEPTTPTIDDQSASTQPSRRMAELESAAPLALPPVYSEADLMAASADDEVLIAAMWAERFVRDYLTVDGDGSTAVEAARLIGVELPEPPADLTSYVEWVDAYSVAAIHPARYRVEVAYRLLTGSASTFVRQPEAAMAVTVDVDVDGTASFAGLPEVITMPKLQPAAGPALVDQIPDWVLDNLSTDPSSVVGAYRDGSDWWVILMSELAPGVIRQHAVGMEG